jgi:hypothetical protein
MPSRWIQDGGLKTFHASQAGPNAAALKIYMAIAMFANFKPNPQVSTAGFAKLSYSDFEEVCGISRQSVCDGIALLNQSAILTINPIGNSQGYILADYDEPGWAKIPSGYLLQKANFSTQTRFAGISIRGALHLEAIKLYLALLTFRHNEAQQTHLSYNKIEEYTGIPRGRIRRSIDVLVNHEWISVASHVYEASDRKPSNVYILRGDFWGKNRRSYARASTPKIAASASSDFVDLS